MTRFLQIINKFRNSKNQTHKNNVSVGNRTITDSMNLICRNPQENTKYLKIESECIISATFVFENSKSVLEDIVSFFMKHQNMVLYMHGVKSIASISVRPAKRIQSKPDILWMKKYDFLW